VEARMEYNFILNIEAVPKARPRFNSKTKRTYTPQQTATFENAINFQMKQKYYAMPLKDIALGLDVTCFLRKPKSAKKRKYPIVKPDADNYLKAICDGLEGVLFDNDSIIIDKTIKKRYADSEEDVRMEIRVWTID
jgi:Holliday junction resolvase RusA-like endonuclease